jgi:hypothetical protein
MGLAQKSVKLGLEFIFRVYLNTLNLYSYGEYDTNIMMNENRYFV